MKQLILAAALVAATISAPAAALTTLGFDDLPGNSFAAVGNYNGLHFDVFLVQSYLGGPPSGYQNGTISPGNIIFNGGGIAATISSAHDFNLSSAWLTSAWNDGQTLDVVGSLNGTQVFTQSFGLNAVTPLLALFNTARIDSVVFSAHGGTRHGYGGGPSNHFVIDDLSFGFAAVPEPASWALLIAGFGMTGATLRRRRTRAA